MSKGRMLAFIFTEVRLLHTALSLRYHHRSELRQLGAVWGSLGQLGAAWGSLGQLGASLARQNGPSE